MNETGDDTEIIEIKWKILGWIMSLTDDVISRIKKLPKDYMLIGTIVYTLVEVVIIFAFILFSLELFLLFPDRMAYSLC